MTELINKKDITILGIESSCDDTSAAVLRNDVLLSNKIANQSVHEAYGGVVPELASRAHQQNIIPVVDQAIREAEIDMDDIDAVAFTQGPGLMGSLLVGTSFAKGFSLSRDIPLIPVNHLEGHVLALFLQDEPGVVKEVPKFPFLCLLVSGGHTQIMVVRDYLNMEIIGRTIDDASGEAFDKCGKVIGLPYPAGPIIDKRSNDGNPEAFTFSKPRIAELDYSFSGLKTSFLYFIRDEMKKDSEFINRHLDDLCASLQKTIVDILIDKLEKAVEQTGIHEIGVAGGVSANSGLKKALQEKAKDKNWKVFIPKLAYTMDNAAMIGITGYYKIRKGVTANQAVTPRARM